MSMIRTFKYKSTDSVIHFDKWIQHTSPARGSREWCEFKPRREHSPAATWRECECGVCFTLSICAATDDRSAASETCFFFFPWSKRSGCCFLLELHTGHPLPLHEVGLEGRASKERTWTFSPGRMQSGGRVQCVVFFFSPKGKRWPSHHFTIHFFLFFSNPPPSHPSLIPLIRV